jgi:hypothetical protein
MSSSILRAGVGVALAGLLLGTSGEAQGPARPPASGAPRAAPFTPKFEVLAETRLLMEGLAISNYRSMQRLLKEKPKDNDTWTFARGQALLVAETGNLLLLRPPRNNGRDTWMKLAMDMRSKAGAVARQAGLRDHDRVQEALAALTTSCNRCHQTFRIAVRVGPEAEKEQKGASDTE